MSTMSWLIQQLRRFWRCVSRARVSILPVTDDSQKAIRIDVLPTQAEENDNSVMNMRDVEAGEPDPNPTGKENFIRSFLQMARKIGMSTFNPSGNIGIPVKGFQFYKDILFMGVFWTGVLFAFLSSFMDAKYYYLKFLQDGGLMMFVKFGFHIITILVQVFLLRLFAFINGRITDMLEKLDELADFGMDPEDQWQEKQENRMLGAFVVTTILKSLLKSGLDKGIISLSISGMIVKRSKFFYHDISIWNVGDLSNSTVTNQLDRDFSEMNPAAKVTMGLLQIMLDFCSEMKMEIAVDLVFVLGTCLLKYTRRLKKRVESQSNEINGDDCAALESPTGNWAYYKKLVAANKALNLVSDGLLKMFHAYNIMKFAYFLMKVFENKATGLQFLYILYSIGKVSATYFIAKQSSGYNSDFQRWMREWGLRSIDPVFILKAILAVETMKAEILGLGTGEFNIGEGFMLVIGSKVASMFMLQVDKADG